MKESYKSIKEIAGQLHHIALLVFVLFFSSLYAQMTWICANNSADWSARAFCEPIIFDNKMWLLCGNGKGVKEDIWHSPDGIHWTQAVKSVPFPTRVSFSCVYHNEKLWVLGGAPSGG